jgi:hypothetical protein
MSELCVSQIQSPLDTGIHLYLFTTIFSLMSEY